MNTLESDNDRLADQLASKVSRLKNVSNLNNLSNHIYHHILYVQIAIDIDTETKEHNRFLDTMVNEMNRIVFKLNIFVSFSVSISTQHVAF